MTIVEKAAYLKGLTEGLGIDGDSKEGKLWTTLCELVSDMAHEIEDLQESSLDFAGALDEMSDELVYLEELTCDLDVPEDPFDDEDDVYDFSDDDEDDAPVCRGRCYCSAPYDDEDDEELDYDGVMYDVTCPTCGEEITFDEGTLSEGSIICPSCGEELEFDLDGETAKDDDSGEDKDE